MLLLFLVPLVAFSNSEETGKYTKNKVIKKEYPVNKDASLTVLNKYGNINIVTGNTDKIEISVSITTNGDDEERVAERLKEINVEFGVGPNTVTAKTIIGKTSSSWNWGRNNNVNMEINYTIKMPVSNQVDLSNDYGEINLDKLEGAAKINCDYGKINIGELQNTNNSINIDYCGKSNIGFMKDGSVNADYSTLHIEKAGRVQLNADYSHLTFGMLVDLVYDCDYGDLKIDECGNITGNCDYMHTSIGKLNGSGVFDVDYGSLKINEFGTGFKKLNIESSYTPIKLGLNSSNAFNFEANLNYSSLKYTEGFTFNKEITKTTSKYYQGYFNKSNSTSQITINSKYGNVSFSNN